MKKIEQKSLPFVGKMYGVSIRHREINQPNNILLAEGFFMSETKTGNRETIADQIYRQFASEAHDLICVYTTKLECAKKLVSGTASEALQVEINYCNKSLPDVIFSGVEHFEEVAKVMKRIGEESFIEEYRVKLGIEKEGGRDE